MVAAGSKRFRKSKDGCFLSVELPSHLIALVAERQTVVPFACPEEKGLCATNLDGFLIRAPGKSREEETARK
jgi:hypothetical protein